MPDPTPDDLIRCVRACADYMRQVDDSPLAAEDLLAAARYMERLQASLAAVRAAELDCLQARLHLQARLDDALQTIEEIDHDWRTEREGYCAPVLVRCEVCERRAWSPE